MQNRFIKKFIIIHITRNKVYKAQMAYMQNIFGLLICFAFVRSSQGQ